jgi:hypothetical protein
MDFETSQDSQLDLIDLTKEKKVRSAMFRKQLCCIVTVAKLVCELVSVLYKQY